MNLNNEPSCEFDNYFPWNNLRIVLFKKNFRKIKQRKSMKQRATKNEVIIAESEVVKNLA